MAEGSFSALREYCVLISFFCKFASFEIYNLIINFHQTGLWIGMFVAEVF